MAFDQDTPLPRLERLLMKWPNSIRLKLAVHAARNKERREHEAKMRRLRGRIQRAVKEADLKRLEEILLAVELAG
jgi:hypothetical protein